MDEDIEIDVPPCEIDPYKTLNISQTATAEQVKSAYKKAALKWHPGMQLPAILPTADNNFLIDKVRPEDKDTAHTRFQELAFAYAVLGDERRRKLYDSTGHTSDILDDEENDFDWVSFYREQFRDVVTVQRITSFSNEYKGSDAEKTAVLDAYTKSKGSWTKIYQTVMLSEAAEDEDRFRAWIDDAIESGEVEGYDKYVNEPEKFRKRRLDESRKKDGKDAIAYAKKIGVHDKLFGGEAGENQSGNADGANGDLAALIQKRQANKQDDFLANLEAKYAPKPRGKKKRSLKDPPEEAFQKTAARARKAPDEAAQGTRRSKRAKE
ncbi:hypothetical protein LTR28_003897 [Elasticomyces elasticus]|nr:hypothetical protein LTR28_003897 [Elasticomyces elasticus]